MKNARLAISTLGIITGMSSTSLPYFVKDACHALDETANPLLIRLFASEKLVHCGPSRVVKLGDRQTIEVSTDGCREVALDTLLLTLKRCNALQQSALRVHTRPAFADLAANYAVLLTPGPQADEARVLTVVLCINC
jgi:hypothetical protein